MPVPQVATRHEAFRGGFTLLEAMTVIVIVGVLATLGELGWSRSLRIFQGKGAAQELRNELLSARSDATTRGRYSGVVIDPVQRRYLRFVDSTGSDVHDGRYTIGERLLKAWTILQGKPSLAISSNASPVPVPRHCGTSASTTNSVSSTGTYSIVFRPDGTATASLTVVVLPETGSKDTFRLATLPATGLVSLER